MILTGCQNTNLYSKTPLELKISTSTSPSTFTSNTSIGFDQEGIKFFKFPELAQVFNDDNQGNFLSLFYNKTDTDPFKIYPALYISKEATVVRPGDYSNTIISGVKVADPSPGYQILDADFNDSWYVWIETDKKNWNLFSINRQNNDKTLLGQGKVLHKNEYDLPGISLLQNQLVYNDNGSKTSKIISIDLSTCSSHDLFAQDEVILQKPRMNDNYIVWTKTDQSNNLSQVYLFNIADKQIKEISSSDNNCIYPYIAKDYVAWLEFPKESKQTDTDRNLVLFNIKENQKVFQTTITKDFSTYKPTISNDILIWPQLAGSYFTCELYSYSIIAKKEEPYFNIASGVLLPTFEDVRILNNWVIWKPSITVPPDPERKAQFTGTYLFPVQHSQVQ